VIYAYALTAAVAFGGGFGSAWYWQSLRQDSAELARVELVRIQAASHRADERRQSEQTIGALNAAQKRVQAARQAAAAANDAAGRLRDDIADIQRRLPSASLDACRQHAAALGTVLNACRTEYEAMGRDAQGHADDSRTMMDAWPRN
jgi:hypothetical protein